MSICRLYKLFWGFKGLSRTEHEAINHDALDPKFDILNASCQVMRSKLSASTRGSFPAIPETLMVGAPSVYEMQFQM